MSDNRSPIPQTQVCKLCGLKRRQVAILANAGAIPGAKRGPDGVHFIYADGPAFRAWAKKQEARLTTRNEWPKPSSERRESGGLTTIDGIAQAFELWKRRSANQLANPPRAFREEVREATREMWEILRPFHEEAGAL